MIIETMIFIGMLIVFASGLFGFFGFIYNFILLSAEVKAKDRFANATNTCWYLIFGIEKSDNLETVSIVKKLRIFFALLMIPSGLLVGFFGSSS